mgnify:CR=1 FL=1
MKQTIIVLGTWSSGSGAVSDYLSSRKDTYNPFGTNEFKLCTDPKGLHFLYNNCYLKKDLLYPSYVFEEFQNYVSNLQRFPVYSDHGKKIKILNKKIIFITNQFLEKITKVKYYGFPHYKALSLNLGQQIKIKLKKKFLNKSYADMKILPLVIPVDSEKFLDLSKRYIFDVIQSSAKKDITNSRIVLNNAAIITDPITSSQYFPNRKIICVTRDPRDIFSGMKMREANSTPWKDVNVFIEWYLHFFANNEFQKILKNRLILNVKFENFINFFDKENQRISKFLNIPQKFIFKKNEEKIFDLNFSKKNLYKSKKFLSKYEFRLIEKKLKKYLQW